MDEQMYGWTDVWMDRCMDGQTWYHCMPYCLSVNGRGITIFHICSNYYSLTNQVVHCRGGLSEFSSTISMDNIELSRHTGVVGKQHRAAVKALGQAAKKNLQLAMAKKRP